MSTQDKDRIKELTRKIKDLEGIIQQKDEVLGDYNSIEKITDGNFPHQIPYISRKDQRSQRYPFRKGPFPHELYPAPQERKRPTFQRPKRAQTFRTHPAAQQRHLRPRHHHPSPPQPDR